MVTFRIPAPAPIDMKLYKSSSVTGTTRFGLPSNVQYCSSCVISNQRPNSSIEYQHTPESTKATIHFDSDGVCDACKVAAKKLKTDWVQREKQLEELCDKHRSNDGSYDCLVPGSGGKDSFFAAHILRYRYGMHPLTVTWAPHIYTDWGWRNFQRWVHAGFDNFLCTPNGRVHRLLTRLAVENLFHPFQPFIIGQKSLAPKMAVLHNIPLVFYGENEAEYGNPIGDAESATRDWKYFTSDDSSNIYLGGVSLKELEDGFNVSRAELNPYLPERPEKIEKTGVQVHYLGYYLKWHPQSCYYYAFEHGGFEASPERTPGTYSKYNSIDDRIDDFHYFTTFVKFGIGRATYDAAQEIRSGDITRDEGVALVKKFDGEFPERFADEIFEYISIRPEEFPEASKNFQIPIVTRDYFDKLTDRFRSPHLWMNVDNSWKLRQHIS